MAAGHGGARPGSGPKPKSSKGKAPPTDAASHYADPLAYLVAVATGEVPGDGLRVPAAKACLAYTTPKARAPVASPAPQKIRAKAERSAAKHATDAWETRAAEIRRRLEAKRSTT
jgi:hypothetical protein